jgi:hypothetical protein
VQILGFPGDVRIQRFRTGKGFFPELKLPDQGPFLCFARDMVVYGPYNVDRVLFRRFRNSFLGKKKKPGQKKENT